jgi:ferric-dicitrate binding protein FerR (iron transport regulator)
MNQDERFSYLLRLYCDGNISVAEHDEFFDQLSTHRYDDILERHIAKDISEGTKGVNAGLPPHISQEIIRNILAAQKLANRIVPVNKRYSWPRWAAAASVLILISAATYFILIPNSSKKEIVKVTPANSHITSDVAPGSNKAVLTLADGSTIILDNTANGTLTQQGSTKVLKLDNGQLTYNSLNDPSTSLRTTEVFYNTIATPRGGQYQLVLSDGSKVWLNSASSLRFPASFVGKERKVELTGEGYFEVAALSRKGGQKIPFIVNVSGKEEVEVLGTHFNINSYADEEAINTTLIEGMVKVRNSQLASANQNQTVTLIPGQQTTLYGNGALTEAKNVNTDEIIAWKGGMFHFERADLKTILRQFARWYDVEVFYEGPVKNRKFFGIVNRNSTLKTVLEMLQDNDIVFHIEGKKLTVKSG